MSIHPTNMACRGILHHLLLFLLLAGSAAPAVAQDRVTYYHTDHAGSPVAATDAGGEVVWRESYAPYGSRQIRQAPDNEVWFTGKREDTDLGLHYFGARWYDAELGRFISVDPAGFDEDNVQLFNRYAYANNNPYRYVDPDGESPLDVAFLVYDIGKLGYRAMTGGDVKGAAVDVGLSAAGVLIPVPGAGQMMKAARTGNQARQGAARGGDVTRGAPKINTPYKRPSGATTAEQRASVQRKPCVDCGAVTPRQVADHRTPLVKEYYKTGTVDTTRMRSLDAVQPQCPTCSARQGAEMSRYSRQMRKELGLE